MSQRLPRLLFRKDNLKGYEFILNYYFKLLRSTHKKSQIDIKNDEIPKNNENPTATLPKCDL